MMQKNTSKAIDFIFSEIEQQRWKGTSAWQLSISCFILLIKSLIIHGEAAQRAYACLRLTPFNPSLLPDLDIDLWPDYADGLQYVCAQSGKCNTIISTNIADFFAAELPVIDPLNFVLRYSAQ